MATSGSFCSHSGNQPLITPPQAHPSMPPSREINDALPQKTHKTQAAYIFAGPNMRLPIETRNRKWTILEINVKRSLLSISWDEGHIPDRVKGHTCGNSRKE